MKSKLNCPYECETGIMIIIDRLVNESNANLVDVKELMTQELVKENLHKTEPIVIRMWN